MKKFILLAIAILCLLKVNIAQQYTSKAAEKIIKGSRFVQINENTKTVGFIILKDDYVVMEDNQKEWLKKNLDMSVSYDLDLNKKNIDKLGYTHYRYAVTYKNIPVDDAAYYVHASKNKVVSVNGEMPKINDVSVVPAINETSAFEKAIAYDGATKYMWENNAMPGYTKPAGILTLVNDNGTFRLAYKFDIYAAEPFSRKYVYVDAASGNIIKTVNRIHTGDVPGTAVTLYNGTRTITTDDSEGYYRLRESGRGGGIETYDLNNATDASGAVDFTDDDNYWDATTDNDAAAYDAHFGTEATYDYYYNTFGLNSFDGAGAKMLSYVHYYYGYNNAFWDGTAMWYGDGDGVDYGPLTSIDVVAHEITHGVTEHSANLIYAEESGALNESFSDIFGVVIDFYANPATANYLMGDQFALNGIPFRSMSNPNDYYCPDTYMGDYWDFAYQEVHTNSGVQNFWFYLLVNGGTGTNDNGDTYNVTGIGMDEAAQIAYRNLSTYLAPGSNYADARMYSIQAAIDLFGNCSAEVIATANAWDAVGVYGLSPAEVTASFEANSAYSCELPAVITFTNLSSNATSFLWDFGDGTTSTDESPVHTYTDPGSFTVSLTVDGINCAGNSDSDVLTIDNYITVANSYRPTLTVVGSSSACYPDAVILTANENSSYLWNTGETTQSIDVDYFDYWSYYGADYWVVNPDSNYCVDNNNSVTVEVNGVEIFWNGSAVLCPGASLTLNVFSSSAGNSILWSNGETTPSITVTTPGIYSVIVDGCSAYNPVEVTASSPPANDNICNAQPLTIGTVAYFDNSCATAQTGEPVPPTVPFGDDYSQDGWYADNADFTAAEVQHSVWYSFIAPSSGAVNIYSAMDVYPYDTQLALYSSSNNTCTGTFTLIAANDDGGDYYSSFINRAYCLKKNKRYFVQVDGWSAATVGTGALVVVAVPNYVTICHVYLADPPKTIKVDGCALATHLAHGDYIGGCTTIKTTASNEEDITALTLAVYPNPTNDMINVSFTSDTEDNYSMKLLDMLGREILSENKSAVVGENLESLSLQKVTPGVYLLIITKGDNVLQTKIVKEE